MLHDRHSSCRLPALPRSRNLYCLTPGAQTVLTAFGILVLFALMMQHMGLLILHFELATHVNGAAKYAGCCATIGCFLEQVFVVQPDFWPQSADLSERLPWTCFIRCSSLEGRLQQAVGRSEPASLDQRIAELGLSFNSLSNIFSAKGA